MLRWNTSSLLAALLLGLIAGLFAFSAGLLVYVRHHLPDTDPGNPFYQLWKRGDYPAMNIDDATIAMMHDSHAASAVLGLSREQLRQRFGTIQPIEQALPQVQRCAANHTFAGDVYALGNGRWLAVLVQDKAVHLIPCGQ